MSMTVHENEAAVAEAIDGLRAAVTRLQGDRPEFDPDIDEDWLDRSDWHIACAERLLVLAVDHLSMAGSYSEEAEEPKHVLAQMIHAEGECVAYFGTVGFSGPMLFKTFNDGETP
jgi:hypothetical protein